MYTFHVNVQITSLRCLIVYDTMRHGDYYFALIQKQCQKALHLTILSFSTLGGTIVLNNVLMFSVSPD